MSAGADVPSPCDKTCLVDPATQLCIGCLRTVDEIARWSAMSNGERARVLEAIAQRRRDGGGAQR